MERKIRADLVERATKELTNVLQLRDATSMTRAAQEMVQPDIAICLGSGRCGFPKTGEDTRLCPFCMRVGPKARHADIASLVHNHVVGN